MKSITFRTAHITASAYFPRLACLCVTMGLFAAATANARYVPDSTTAAHGVFDISLRGDAAISPGVVYAGIGGNQFITAARRNEILAVCAFTTGAVIQASFGNAGCYRETMTANQFPYQLLVGKSGYWIFIADAANAKRFTLLRLTPTGQPDVTYGTSGRRTFDLGCDATDTASRCPEIDSFGAQQLLSFKPFIAETSDSNLWLLASRKSAVGADEGVLLHIDQARTIGARVNLYDALPPSWVPGMQAGVSFPHGVVAHGDAVLVEHRTNFGYVLIRIDGNSAIDRSFGGSGYLVAGDGALPANFFQMPVVAADNTFLWGLGSADARGRTRYDAHGSVLGPLPIPEVVYRTYVMSVPASFGSAAVPLWMWDGTRVGRWVNGQWDPSTFGGQGPFQPATGQTLFALMRDESALAMIDVAVASGSTTVAKLTIVATQAAASPRIVDPVTQPDAVLVTEGLRADIDPRKFVRYATQADGRIVWQRLTLDSSASAPDIATGTLGMLPAAKAVYMVVGDASTSGLRWAVRAQQLDATKPTEFYADLVDTATTGTTPRRVNMDAIRAQMPAFQPFNPVSNPVFLNVETAADGSAMALIRYRGNASGNVWDKIARVKWTRNAIVANEYLAQFSWSYDVGATASDATVQSDAQGRLLLMSHAGKSITRLSAQGALDTTFGQAGRLDLLSMGFLATDFSSLYALPRFIVKTLTDGSLWVDVANRLAHLDNRGELIALIPLPPQAPLISAQPGSRGVQNMLAESDGSAIAFYFISPQYRVLRFTPSGELDAQFGLRGAETMAPDGASLIDAFSAPLLPMANRSVAMLLNDSIRVYRYDSARPGPSGTTVPAIEFYNTTLDHYFMTADPAEIAGIETGAAGPGWQRTGQSFSAYASLIDAPGNALDMCRFYGSAVPRSTSPNGRTGPNSHFYTLAGAECDNINSNDKAWQFEGPRLALMPLAAAKTCAEGQQPVFRAYNKGYQISGGVWTKNDSNHRYSTSQTTISEMVSKGWSAEGATFCAPI